MSKFYLVRFTEDCSDEFYVNGMKVFTEEEYKVFEDNLNCIENREDYKDIEIYFGTNEYLYFFDNHRLAPIFEVKEISEQEYNTLVKLNLKEFGDDSVFNYVEHFDEYEEEE